MLYHLIINTSYGYCAVIFTKNPFILKKVLLPEKKLKTIKEKILSTASSIEDKKNTDAKKIAFAIKNYFNNGCPIQIDRDILDLNNHPPFYKKILLKTAEIPFAEVCSYRDLSEAANNPKASRATGGAMATNPFPIIIPCHRVIKTDGSVGKFGGGSELKKKMINLERQANKLPPLY
ncbi:MAG: methylated-DNA--[protein]-cysteine S-methyltransferase [Deltaproteobacteria bacterium]|nr:methylated-DNA--[protein]-cysteine S-methyltransferase [Deltaproteobacteria bacterium]